MEFIRHARIIFVTLISLLACDPPYAVQVTEFNEKGFQQPAAMTMSDPQVFLRE